MYLSQQGDTKMSEKELRLEKIELIVIGSMMTVFCLIIIVVLIFG